MYKKTYIKPQITSVILPQMMAQLNVSGTSDEEARSNDYKFGNYLWEDHDDEEEQQISLF